MRRLFPVLLALVALFTATSPAFSFPSEAGEAPAELRSTAAQASIAQLRFEQCTLTAEAAAGAETEAEVWRRQCLNQFLAVLSDLRQGMPGNMTDLSRDTKIKDQMASSP